MALDVTALTDYVNVHKDELFVKAVAKAKTLDYVEIMPNVKYKEALIYLDTTAGLQADSCGFTPNTTDVFDEKYVEVKSVKSESEVCWLDLQKKALNHELKFEAGRETVPFADLLAENQALHVQKEVDKIVWAGDSSLSIDGFKAQITASQEATEATKGDTIVGTVDNMVALLPTVALEKGVDIFLPMAAYREYIRRMNEYCCANRPLIDAASAHIDYVGDSRIRIIGIEGMEGTNFAVATSRDNLVYATDIIGSEGVFKMWRDETDDVLRTRIRFNMGTALKYEDEIVYANL